jgi:ribosomal protein S18 acetylase RimI-like enzyme
MSLRTLHRSAPSEFVEEAAPSGAEHRKPPISLVTALREDDYVDVYSRIDAWTRGRFIGVSLPRSFFRHFAGTSFLIRIGGKVVGVLVGFVSQASPGTAYVHFVGVEPGKRRTGLGRELYLEFFQAVARLGCHQVESIAPPVNSSAIAFHRQLGFEVVEGGTFCCGISASENYAGPGQHRVLFRKCLGGTLPASEWGTTPDHDQESAGNSPEARAPQACRPPFYQRQTMI